MTYKQQLAAVVSKLDSDGADSEEEWAANILRAIGIHPPTEIEELAEVETEQPDVVKLVPREQVNYGTLQPRLASDEDQNQVQIEANAEQRI